MRDDNLVKSVRKPAYVAPPGSCDTHVHFYDSSYPEAASATKTTPPNVTVADYQMLRNRLGTERVVVVQPTTYGLDNRCQIAAVEALGSDSRLVVVVNSQVTDGELARLDKLGTRGARFFMLSGGALPWSELEPVAAHIAPFGWHIELQLNGWDVPDYVDRLKALPTDIVVDHVGRYMPPVSVNHPSFTALLDLMNAGKTWIKLSAPYVHSKAGPPDYVDIQAQAQELVHRFPERILWASNWPHPGQPGHPDEADMLDLLLCWVDDEMVRTRILVENPAIRYGFD